MKKFWLAAGLWLCFCLIMGQGFAGSEQNINSTESSLQNIQSEMQNFVEDMISITGGMVSGMVAGVQEGAEKIQAQLDGADGTQLISNKKELQKFVQVQVLKLEDQSNGDWRVTLAVKNSNDFPVRLVNLTHKQTALLLDIEGFAHDQSVQEDQSRTATIPSRSAIKITFVFAGLENNPKVFRLFEMDYPFNQEI